MTKETDSGKGSGIPETVPAQVLADLLGISVRRTEQLANEGVIVRAGKGEYVFAESVQAFTAYRVGIEERRDNPSMRRFNERRIAEIDAKMKRAGEKLMTMEELETCNANLEAEFLDSFDRIAAELGGELAAREIAAAKERLRKKAAEIRKALETGRDAGEIGEA